MSRRQWRSLGIPTEDAMAIPWMRAGLVVTALARPEWVVEIDATAVIPPERA